MYASLAMDYYISRNQETYGPYSEVEIKGHLKSGALFATDHAWRDGEIEWIPLGQLLTLPVIVKTEDPVLNSSKEKPSSENLPDASEASKSGSENSTPDAPSKGLRGGFRIGRIFVIAVGILLLGYLVSPYVCLILLSRALGSGDAPMIDRLVDFPTLREGLHAEAAAKQESLQSVDQPKPYLGVAPDGIPAAVDYLERRYLNSSGLASLLSRPELAIREQSAGTFASMAAQRIDLARLHWAFFTGPAEFEADLNDLKLTFRLSGGFWRLEQISFP
jgi:GYF domain 2/Protein of unknown function (DUF2939)